PLITPPPTGGGDVGTCTDGCTYMHFGENQLSPGSIGISPLTTGHPPVLQHGWVRASTRSHPRFTLPMASSPGFGPTAGDSSPSPPAPFRWRPPGPPRRLPWGAVVLPHRQQPPTLTRRIILQKARRHPGTARPKTARPTTKAPTACGCGGSGSLSSPSRGAF